MQPVTEVGATARLLQEVFPHSEIASEDYLSWLYEQSPFGSVVETNLDDEAGRAGHYAVVPIELADGDQAFTGALSLNTAVHERARGGGVFTRLAEETYDKARVRGIRVVVGVANANSTPGFVKRLGFTSIGPLPVRMHLPRPRAGRSVRSAGAAAVGANGLEQLAPLLAPPAGGLARRWTPDTLAWRLRAPRHDYAVHVTREAAAVSALTRRRGVRIAVLCGVLAPAPLDRAGLTALVTAACRSHRAPVAVHLGHNLHLPAGAGRPLPERFREAPLNLIHRDLDGTARPPAIARWEALDFDAF